MTLIKQLIAARENAGLSQADLAPLLGVTPGSIGHYEAERRRVPVKLAAEWATACGRRLEVLVIPGESRLAPVPSERAQRLIIAVAGLTEDNRAICEQLIEHIETAHPVAREAAARMIDLLAKSAQGEGAARS